MIEKLVAFELQRSWDHSKSLDVVIPKLSLILVWQGQVICRAPKIRENWKHGRISFCGSTSPFSLQQKVRAVAAAPDNPAFSCCWLNLLCRPPQVAALKPFPGAAANPVWSRAHVLARGAIRGLTLPRRSLLKTDRLSGTPRSSHLKHAAIASCCRNDHAPVIGARESPLVRKRVGLGKKVAPRNF